MKREITITLQYDLAIGKVNLNHVETFYFPKKGESILDEQFLTFFGVSYF